MALAIMQIASPLGITVHDHLIVGKDGHASLRTLKLIQDGFAFSGRCAMKQIAFSQASTVKGQCLCGNVRFEIDYPAFWAWHDHTRPSRIARRGLCDLCGDLAQAFSRHARGG